MKILDFFEILVWVIIGSILGWLVAHDSISVECKRLGGFYVGSTTYQCEVKK